MIKFLKILFVSLFVFNTVNAQISTKEVEKLLKKYEIKNPDIVMRIGILESASFTSSKAINHHNIFGFETGKTHFKSYDEAVYEYKVRVESRLKEGEDYYKFLKRIGYAKDKKYIWKLKNIKYDKRNSVQDGKTNKKIQFWNWSYPLSPLQNYN